MVEWRVTDGLQDYAAALARFDESIALHLDRGSPTMAAASQVDKGMALRALGRDPTAVEAEARTSQRSDT